MTVANLLQYHCLSDKSETFSDLYIAVCKLSLKDLIRFCEELVIFFGKNRVSVEYTNDFKVNVAIPHVYRCIQENIAEAEERFDGLCEISFKLGLARLSVDNLMYNQSNIETLVKFVDKKHRPVFIAEIIDAGACNNLPHLINSAIKMMDQYPPNLDGVELALEHAHVRGHTECAKLIEDTFYEDDEEETTMDFIEAIKIMDELRPRIQGLKSISDEDADNMIISIYEACCDEDDCYTSPDDDSLDELVNFFWKPNPM